MDNVAEVHGFFVPGESSSSLVEVFKKSDLLIAKGTGNYEALKAELGGKRAIFMLKVKCKPIATDTGAPVGTFVVNEGLRFRGKPDSKYQFMYKEGILSPKVLGLFPSSMSHWQFELLLHLLGSAQKEALLNNPVLRTHPWHRSRLDKRFPLQSN